MEHHSLPREGAGAPTVSRGLLLGVSAFVCGTLILRLPWLTESLWYDEIYRTASRLKAGKLQVLLLNDVHNPLYNTFMFGWINLFGDSEVSIRVPSLIAGYLAVAMLCTWLWRVWDRQVALFVGAWLLLTPAHVWYSTEAKNNMFTLLMTVLLWVTFERLTTAGSRLWFLGAAAAVTLALYTDFATLPMLGAVLLCVLLAGEWQAIKSRTARAGLAVTLGLLPVLPLLIYKSGHVEKLYRSYVRRFDFVELYLLLANYFPTGNAILPYEPYQPWQAFESVRGWFYVSTGLGVLWLLAIGVSASRTRRAETSSHKGQVRQADSTPSSVWLWVPLLVPLLIMLAASGIIELRWPDGTRQIYQERNLLYLLCPFAVLLAFGLRALKRTWVRRTASIVVLGLALGGSLLMTSVYRDLWTVYKPNPDWRSAARYFDRESAASGQPAVVLFTAPAHALKYYTPNFRVLRRRQPLDPEVVEEAMQTRGRSSIYLLSNHQWNGLKPGDLRQLGPQLRTEEVFTARGLTIYRLSRVDDVGTAGS